MSVLLGAAISAISGILIDKGMGLVVDVCDSLTDVGVEKTKELIKNTTGVDVTDASSVMAATPEEVKAVITSLQENMVEIMRIHQQYRQQDLENTKDARAMHMLMMNAGFKSQFTIQNILAISQIVFAMTICTSMIFFQIPTENQGYANTILGFILGSVWGVILNFYFGNALKEKATTAIGDVMNQYKTLTTGKSYTGGHAKSFVSTNTGAQSGR